MGTTVQAVGTRRGQPWGCRDLLMSQAGLGIEPQARSNKGLRNLNPIANHNPSSTRLTPAAPAPSTAHPEVPRLFRAAGKVPRNTPMPPSRCSWLWTLPHHTGGIWGWGKRKHKEVTNPFFFLIVIFWWFELCFEIGGPGSTPCLTWQCQHHIFHLPKDSFLPSYHSKQWAALDSSSSCPSRVSVPQMAGTRVRNSSPERSSPEDGEIVSEPLPFFWC